MAANRSRRLVRHPVVLRELEVLRVGGVTPRMRRVTLGGGQLGAFSKGGRDLPPFRTAAFDDHVKLFFAAPSQAEPVLPAQDDGRLDWPEERPRPVHRDYTVRRYDAAAGELDIDVVCHGGGVASRWAAQAAPGDRIHLAGPRASHLLPIGAARYLLVGDETALPAIARWVEEMPAATLASVVVEVAGPAEEQRLASTADITWAHRNGAPAGNSELLVQAVRALELPCDGVYAWVAGELGSVQRVRAHLRHERGLVEDRIDVTGYWRGGQAAGETAGENGAGVVALHR